jgi:hypothetical protein
MTNLNPYFSKTFLNAVDISISIEGHILSMFPTTMTSDPNLLNTLPNSRPMTPLPITTIVLGIFSKVKHPVEDTIYFSSAGKMGNGDGSLPVAIMTFFAFILSVPPLIRSISISFLEANLP